MWSRMKASWGSSRLSLWPSVLSSMAVLTLAFHQRGRTTLQGGQHNNGGIILKPQPSHTRQTYEQKYGPQTVEVALFEAFGVIFRPDFCSFFALYVGAGVTRIFLNVTNFQS